MPKTLLVGCSFVDTLLAQNNPFRSSIDFDQYCVLASPGSGNQAIAARTIYQLSQHRYDRVCVLWSGINRVDFPVSKALWDIYSQSSDHGSVCNCVVGSMCWYHSGGLLGSGVTSAATPKSVQQFFKTQYLDSDSNSQYLSDLTLLSVIATQSVLEKTNIDYKMAFIYDINRTSNQEHCHGVLNQQSPLCSLVDWQKFCQFESVYEWAKRTKKQQSDNYHPTAGGMIEWLKLAMDIDLIREM